MARSPEKFAQMLTEGIYKITFREAKTLKAVQDELGYSLGKKGGASIEYWRKGNMPSKLLDLEELARQIVTRGSFTRDWLEEFLHYTDHPAPASLCNKLFPQLQVNESHPAASPLPSQQFEVSLPVDIVPNPAPLPPGSLMPLSSNPLFVGRKQDLQALASALKREGIAAVSEVKTVATTGLGGIGKTQLACEFVHRYGQFFPGGVFWLSFEDATTVGAKIATCGGPGVLDLSPAYWGLPLDDQIRLVQNAWQQPVPRLLVFDNCEDPALLHRWRPSNGGCRILVTSRHGDWEAALGVQALTLGVLLREESIALLRYHCPKIAEAILDAIAEELGDLPLALHLAGRYLRRYPSVQPIDYLKRLRSADLLRHPSLQEGDISPTNHIQHVGRTFALSYDRLDPQHETDAIALALLVRIAHFAPGEPIWQQLLLKTLDLASDDLDAGFRTDRAFRRLIDLGLIETEQDAILRMHRLVAAFVRDVAKDQVEAVQKTVEAVVFEETERINREGYPVPLLAWQLHLRSVADIAQARADERGARLCNEMGEHLRQIGDYRGARLYLEKALEIWNKISSVDHLDTVENLNNLGRLLRDEGHLAEAQRHLINALAIRKRILGEAHPRTAESYNELGRWFYSKGNLAEAKKHFEQALAISRQVFGEEHRCTADYLNNLGMCLENLGDLVKARQHLEQALAIRRKVLGENHPRTALSLNNMGYFLRPQGELSKAQFYYEQALAIRRKVFGEDHPDTAESLNNVGEILYAQGKVEAARNYLELALAVYEKVLGYEHTDIAYTLNNLGTLLQVQGDIVKARTYLVRALTIRQKGLGDNHPLTLLSQQNLSKLP